jgi:cell division protein FtsZ
MQVTGHAGLDAVNAIKQPAVWRQGSASQQIENMKRNGVDGYEIPAFLRREILT